MKILLIFLFILIGLNIRYHLVLCIIFGFILLIWTFRRFSKKFTFISLALLISALGISFIRINVIRNEYQGLVIESKENYFLMQNGFERLYVYQKDNTYEIGDFITVSGNKNEIKFSTIESAFDFNNYLNKKGVYYQLSNPKIKTIFSNPIRLNAVRNNFLSAFSDTPRSIIKAVLFGVNDNGEINQRLNDMHLGRLLSISGVYIYAFLGALTFLLALFLKEKWSKLIALIILMPYLIFTFPKFSVLKIGLIFLLRWLNDFVFKKKIEYETILGGTGLFFLACDYFLAGQDCFLLGYLIPIFVMLLNRSFTTKRKYIKKLKVSFCVILFFIPFSVSYNNELNLLQPIYQIIFTPIMIGVAFSSLLCFCHIPLHGVLNQFLIGFESVTKNVSRFTLAIYMPPLNEWMVVIYYLLLYFLIYYFLIKFKPMKKIAICVYASFLLLNALPIYNLVSEEVSFINVGQGDACLIRKGTTSILIDTGGSLYNDIARESLIPYFKKKRIYNIDLLITTHDDFDHSGAVSSLLENFHVKRYVADYKSFPIKEGNITLNNYNLYSSSWLEDNDRSLVIGFHLVSSDFLIMGDAPKKIENLIMKDNPSLKCDVLKIGHHGSDTSSSQKFISFLKPKDAIVSVGRNNYGHPHQSVLNILKSYHINIKRTDEIGTITYSKWL